MFKSSCRIVYVTMALLLHACSGQPSSNKEMTALLATIASSEYSYKNTFCSDARYHFFDSVLHAAHFYADSAYAEYVLANTLLEMGREQPSIDLFEKLLQHMTPEIIGNKQVVMKNLAMAYLRLGERNNCVYNHAAESCVFPISNKGIHADKQGAEKAIALYRQILTNDPTDLESRWLLNIAYMAAGEYPGSVPADLLIPIPPADTSCHIQPFTDIAAQVGVNINNLAGGSIVDDFNNDGYADIITSSWSLYEGMHYLSSNGHGGFTDWSASSGLNNFTGGLNIMQTDYNNDGWKDIFVLRGAWKGSFGKEPNSLLRNNGDGTFTDVTRESGLLSFFPTQTATWADFNNDGWLDVFIGNETSQQGDINPCELYMNNRNGTFTEMAAKAACAVVGFVKGVTSGDYDNDGRIDIFISTLDGKKILLKNEGTAGGDIRFKDVSEAAGLTKNTARTFPTWFWDYDNDGWLDILVCGYEFNRSLSWYAAQEALHMPVGNSGKVFLFHNLHNGSFEDVSEKAGLNSIAFAMGANFGDIDNDGYADFYLGTGNPQYTSLVPNKMFKNIDGNRFVDITSAARVGNLQKGHGVSFADIDNDGDEDIYIDMGGAYNGDGYQNALYLNPGQNHNHSINLVLQGTASNRAAIGAAIKVTFTENGKTRSVYAHVNSGGSFGSNPLMQHIGTGQATRVSQIDIQWPGSGTKQVFKDLPADHYFKITEGNNSPSMFQLRKLNLTATQSSLLGCAPAFSNSQLTRGN